MRIPNVGHAQELSNKCHKLKTRVYDKGN